MPWTVTRQASLSITNSCSLLKLMSIESMMPSNLQPSHPLSSPSPPAFNLSQHQGLFQWVSSLHQVAKVLELQLQHQSFQYSGLISFMTDWFDVLAVQRTLKSLLHHHSSKTSVLQCSAFFMLQLSHLYMTTGKTTALTRWTFVGKVRSLLFNMLFRLAIAFLPRSKCLLISCLSSHVWCVMSSHHICSDFGTQENKVCHCFHCFPIYLPWSDRIDAMILVFWMLSFKPDFSLFSFTFMKRLLFVFCHKGAVICISEVTDISPCKLDFSLCFIQSGISHDVLYI